MVHINELRRLAREMGFTFFKIIRTRPRYTELYTGLRSIRRGENQ